MNCTEEQRVSLSPGDDARIRAVIREICGAAYLEAIEQRAAAAARFAGYSRDGYAAARVVAPAIVDLLFALDPEFMTGLAD